MKSKTKEILSDIIFCGGGCILYSAAIHIFAEENDIAHGGATGVAMLVNYLFPKIPIGVSALIINIPLFILAWKFIGGKFIAKSFLVTLFLSVAIDMLSFLPSYKGDKILATCFCGALSGISMALIFIRGLTSGGTDILARLINLKKPHLSMGRLILIADFVVVISAGLIYRNFESVMYSLILIFISTFVVDKILFGLTDSRTLLIISSCPEKISKNIMEEMSRGVSIISVKGAYTGESRKMLMCALRKSQINKIVKRIYEIDERAFTVILSSSEVLGEGFNDKR